MGGRFVIWLVMKNRMIFYKELFCFQGRVVVMMEKWEGEPLDPTPNFDCHVSRSAATSDLFESSQVR